MASSFLLSVSPLMKDEEPRNWADLPRELLSSILLRLGIDDILERAQKMCRSWRRVCKEPLMWRKIDMRNLQGSFILNVHCLCRHVIDLSQRGLEINISTPMISLPTSLTDFTFWIMERMKELRWPNDSTGCSSFYCHLCQF